MSHQPLGQLDDGELEMHSAAAVDMDDEDLDEEELWHDRRGSAKPAWSRLHLIIAAQTLLLLVAIAVAAYATTQSQIAVTDLIRDDLAATVAATRVASPTTAAPTQGACPVCPLGVMCPPTVECPTTPAATERPTTPAAAAPEPAPFSLALSLAAALDNVPTPPSSPPTMRPATFTPPATLAARGWPLPTGTAKGVIVTLFSSHVMNQLQGCFERVEKHLLVPHGLTWLIVFERFPIDARKHMEEFARHNGLVRTDNLTQKHKRGVTLDGAVFRSKLGATIRMRAIILSTPKYLDLEPQQMNREDWSFCAYESSDEYIHYNTFFIYHLIQYSFPELDEFDYMMKMDSDINWIDTPPFNPITQAGDQGCIFGHSQLDEDKQDCHFGAAEALQAYSKTYGVQAKSGDKPWCQGNEQYFYGNLVFASMAWLRSVENRHFAQFLFESKEHSKYWKYRWGDQPIWPRMICLFYEIDNLRSDKQVCDISAWRNKYFRHK